MFYAGLHLSAFFWIEIAVPGKKFLPMNRIDLWPYLCYANLDSSTRPVIFYKQIYNNSLLLFCRKVSFGSVLELLSFFMISVCVRPANHIRFALLYQRVVQKLASMLTT